MFSADFAIGQSVPLSLARRQRLSALLEMRNPQQRLGAIVEAVRGRKPLPDSYRTEGNCVKGCLVRTWFVSEIRDGRCYFQSESDAAMLKALLGLLCETFSGYSPDEILAEESGHTLGFLNSLRVLHQLAENRQRTLLHVEAQLCAFAKSHAVRPVPALAPD